MNDFWRRISASAFLLVITLVAIGAFIESSKNNEPVIIPVISPSEFPDYDAFQVMEKRLIIVQDQESFSPKDKSIIGRVEKNIKIKGEFSRAYLYVESSVDNGKPLSQFDSIFINLDYSGGHLFRKDSLKLPNGNITKLLYGLNQVPVLNSIPYSETKTPKILDWFNLLQDGNIMRFDTFLSSLRPGGKLNLIEIRYECEVGIVCEMSIQ